MLIITGRQEYDQPAKGDEVSTESGSKDLDQSKPTLGERANGMPADRNGRRRFWFAHLDVGRKHVFLWLVPAAERQ